MLFSNKLFVIGAVAVLTTTLCTSALSQEKKRRKKGKTSTELGIRKNPVKSPSTPPPLVTLTGKKPGDNKAFAKSYGDAPPMIPHTVVEYLPIGQRNQCLNCHTNPPRVYRKLTVVPTSHYVDRKGRKVGKGPVTVKDIYQGFYNCTMCHAPQWNAKPLKKNAFRGDER